MTEPTPVLLDPAIAAGVGLDPISDWPEAVLISGAQPTRVKSWFEGQITAQVIDIPDGALRFKNTDFDEVCVILNGSVTLANSQATHIFQTGDCYVIPKGFDGTFSTSGGYRAMTVMSTDALKQLMDDWKIEVGGT